MLYHVHKTQTVHFGQKDIWCRCRSVCDKSKSITLINYHEIKGASGGIAPCILKLGPRYGRVVNGS
jgi:hypothetical protein